MKHFRMTLAVTTATLLLTIPARAMPDDTVELNNILAAEYGGDANSWVEDNIRDFRQMACRGRTDLVRGLLDNGLDLAEISGEPMSRMLSCALYEEQAEVLELVVTPETVQTYERYHMAGWGGAPFWIAGRSDNYTSVRLLLDNGATIYDSTISLFGTREDHILYAAYAAHDNRRGNTLRAIEDAGFGPLVIAAQDQAYVEAALIVARGEDLENDGMLGGLLDVALGAAVGGLTGDALMVAGGLDALSGDGEDDQPGVHQGFVTPAEIMRLSHQQEAAETQTIAEAESPASTSPAPSSNTLGTLEELDRLADLRDRGVLSEAEFDAMKAQILNGN